MRRLSVALVPLILLAGCGSPSEPEGEASKATSPPPASKAAPPDAEEIARKLKSEIPSVNKTVTITEDNDPNNAIGRPGQYQQAVVLYDKQAKCEDPNEVNVSCGAKIEIFAKPVQANNRKKYLQKLAEASNGIISEYDYVDGAVILRINGELKPSVAKKYEAAFTQ